MQPESRVRVALRAGNPAGLPRGRFPPAHPHSPPPHPAHPRFPYRFAWGGAGTAASGAAPPPPPPHSAPLIYAFVASPGKKTTHTTQPTLPAALPPRPRGRPAPVTAAGGRGRRPPPPPPTSATLTPPRGGGRRVPPLRRCVPGSAFCVRPRCQPGERRVTKASLRGAAAAAQAAGDVREQCRCQPARPPALKGAQTPPRGAARDTPPIHTHIHTRARPRDSPCHGSHPRRGREGRPRPGGGGLRPWRRGRHGLRPRGGCGTHGPGAYEPCYR